MSETLSDAQMHWAEIFTGVKLGVAAAPTDAQKGQVENVTGINPTTSHTHTALGGPPPTAAAPATTTSLPTAQGAPAQPATQSRAHAAQVQAQIAQGKTTIGTTYGTKSVVDGDAPWAPAELQTVSDAFAKIPAGDRDVLKGIDVTRAHSIDGTHDARYSVDTSSAPAVQTTKIEVADSNFANDGQATPPDEQKRVIVHEVGHAVAGSAQR
jgi:hypothetical protein